MFTFTCHGDVDKGTNVTVANAGDTAHSLIMAYHTAWCIL